MALTGELSDLSLAELIEFFCNQRKTGRLEVSYPKATAHFFLQAGNVVHAEIGALRGIEAVYYALTLANASFAFNVAAEMPKQTIKQPWTSVVLEGLRRMDEGISPANPFPNEVVQATEPVEEHIAAVVDSAAPVEEQVPEVVIAAPVEEQVPATHPLSTVQDQVVDASDQILEVEEQVLLAPEQTLASVLETHEEPTHIVAHEEQIIDHTEKEDKAFHFPGTIELEPFGLPHVHSASPAVQTATLFAETQPGGAFAYTPWKLGAIAGAVVLAIAVVAVPWGWYARSKAVRLNVETPTVASDTTQPTTEIKSNNGTQPEVTSSPMATASEPAPANENGSANSTNADAEKKAREARFREEARLKARAADNVAANPAAQQPTTTSAPQLTKEQSTAASASKHVTVQVTYDENGRVTQASGGDATALRIARQKRFPPGKPGSATITIPIN